MCGETLSGGCGATEETTLKKNFRVLYTTPTPIVNSWLPAPRLSTMSQPGGRMIRNGFLELLESRWFLGRDLRLKMRFLGGEKGPYKIKESK